MDLSIVPQFHTDWMQSDSLIAAVDDSFGFGEFTHDDEMHELEFTPQELREVMWGSGKLEPGLVPVSDASKQPLQVVGPNIAVTSANLRNGAGTSITSPVIGERVAVQVNFMTQGLPAGANYKILFTVDGVALESAVVTSGANGANGNYFWWRSGRPRRERFSYGPPSPAWIQAISY